MHGRRGPGRPRGAPGCLTLEDEMIIVSAEGPAALWPAPCPSLRHTLPVSPSPGTRKLFGVPVGEQISTLVQVQANSEAWKVVCWGLESLVFLRLLPSGRALSAVRWRGPVALRCDVICVTLKIARLSTASPAIRLLCLVDITFLPRAALQNEVLVNSSWAFIR